VLLHIGEELLNGIEPGRVLSIKEDYYLEALRSLEYLRELVDDGVVNEQNHLLVREVLVSPDASQCLVHEVFKDDPVEGSLNDLTADEPVLRDSSDEAERELLLFGFLLQD